MAAEQIEQGSRTLAEIVEAYKGKLLVIVLFAKWCDPCRRLLEQVLPTVAKQAGRGVAICQINIVEGDNRDAPVELKTHNIPISLFFRRGREVDRIEGMIKPEDFIRRIKAYRK